MLTWRNQLDYPAYTGLTWRNQLGYPAHTGLMSPSICSIWKHVEFHVGIKFRVSMWSFLSIVHPLRTPIPMCKKKVWVQEGNLYKMTYCLPVLPTKFLHYVPYTQGVLMGWRNFSKTAEKKFLQPTRSGCTWRNVVREAHTGLISLSVCLSIRNTKTRRIFP